MKDPDQAMEKRAPVYLHQAQAGLLLIAGSDRKEYLQRQTTNDIRPLSPGGVLPTVLTSPTARLLDVLYLLEDNEGEEEVIEAVTLPGRGPATASYLKSRIFFMDKVSVTDVSERFTQFDLMGPGIEQAVKRWGLLDPLEKDQVLSADLNGMPVRLFPHNPHLGLGYRLISPLEELARVEKALQSAGLESLTTETYEVMRVEAGLPAADRELSEEYTPLETNLEAAISETKGCYTGQEVIARQITYNKVTRRMVGLYLEAETSPGAQVRAEGKLAGTVTSAVISPRLGPIALAILKRPYNHPGIEVTVGDGHQAVPAKVCSLPFISVGSN